MLVCRLLREQATGGLANVCTPCAVGGQDLHNLQLASLTRDTQRRCAIINFSRIDVCTMLKQILHLGCTTGATRVMQISSVRAVCSLERSEQRPRRHQDTASCTIDFLCAWNRHQETGRDGYLARGSLAFPRFVTDACNGSGERRQAPAFVACTWAQHTT